MHTSVIRHPKRDYYVQIHDWQMKATGNVHAAALLSILEDEVINYVSAEPACRPKTRGWLTLNLVDLQKRMFCKLQREVTHAIDILEAIGFIKTNAPDDLVCPEHSVLLYLDAVKVNEYTDNLSQPKKSEPTASPLMSLMLAAIAANRPRGKEVTVSMRKQSEQLFEFWKVITSHNRSRPQPKWLKLFIDRMSDGYDVYDIAQGIIGLTFSDHHTSGAYDHVKYVVGDTEKLDRMMALAAQRGVNRDRATERFNAFNTGADVAPLFAKPAVPNRMGLQLK